MVGKVYTVYDRVAQDSVVLFESRNDASAVRSFHNFMQSIQGKPDDFRLLRVGAFDHEKSLITHEEVPVDIPTAVVKEE